MTAAPRSRVVDACAAAQLFVPEPLTTRAVALFQWLGAAGTVVHVPDLFYAECANIFWKKVQRGSISQSAARVAMADTLALPLRPTPCAILADDALDLAL